jgi:hypothetical protein
MGGNMVRTLCGVLALSTVALLPICSAADFTAKEGLARAEKAAAEWRSDAALTGVGTTLLKADGKAAVWQYDYVSPENSTCARVLIIGQGDARLQNMGRCIPAKPVPENFVDSPEMLQAAVAAGFKPEETSNAYLRMERDGAAADSACWINFTSLGFDKENAAERGWCVNPETGHFALRLGGSE